MEPSQRDIRRRWGGSSQLVGLLNKLRTAVPHPGAAPSAFIRAVSAFIRGKASPWSLARLKARADSIRDQVHYAV